MKVKMKTVIGQTEREFEISHAQRILDVQAANPPRTWVLNDPNYKEDEYGKIVPGESETKTPESVVIEE